MRKNAFTLTETLLMVAVVGIIAVISAVSLKNITPDKDVVMIRKAYTDVSKAVAVLINNQELYPYARVAMKNIDSKLNPMWQYVAAASCDQLYVDDITKDNPETSDVDKNLTYQYAIACGGGGGGGGSTLTSSSTSSSTGLSTNGTLPSLTSGGLTSSTSSSSSGGKLVTSVTIRDFEKFVDAGSDDISKGSGSVSGSNLQDGTYADKPLQQEGSSIDLAAHGAVFLNTAVMDDSDDYTSSNKFAYNFAKLFKTGDLSCSGRVCEFTTPDGMEWTVTDNFSVAASQTATIKVDINGSSAGSNSSTASKPDIFTFKVDASGAVTIDGNDEAATKAKRVLKDRKAKK